MDDLLNEQGYDRSRHWGGFPLKNVVSTSLFLILAALAVFTLGMSEAEAADNLVVYDDALASG